MNNCVLMGTIMTDPELRYTTEKLQISQMLLEFDTQQNDRTNNAPIMARLKAVGFGNLAEEIQQKYNRGDRVVVVGRLAMNTIERDGYKEKRAELNISHIYPIGASDSNNIGSKVVESEIDDRASTKTREKVVPINSHSSAETDYEVSDSNYYGYEPEEIPTAAQNLDEIPF